MMNLTDNNGDRANLPNEIIKILIVDDQKMIREGLKALIHAEKT